MWQDSVVAPRPIDTIKTTLDLKKRACHVLEKKSSFAITIIDFFGVIDFDRLASINNLVTRVAPVQESFWERATLFVS